MPTENLKNKNTNQNPERRIPEILRGRTYLDPRYDPAFRAFFSDEAALTDFLNSLLHLEPGRRINRLSFTFADPLEFRIPEPKTVIFDIHAVTEDGRFLDVEMQRAKHSFFVDRVLLYSAFLAIKGKHAMEASGEFLALDDTERKRRRYQLPETISIWICNFHPMKSFEGYRDTWGFYSENRLSKGEFVAVSEKMKYIVIDLPNFAKENKVGSREEMWLYLLANAGDSDDLDDFDDPLVADALERIRVSTARDELLSEQAKEMTTQDEIDVRIADGIILGRAEGREKGLAEGREKGLAEGRAEGRAEGELQKAREMAKGLLEDGVPLVIVRKHSGLSEEEIKSL